VDHPEYPPNGNVISGSPVTISYQVSQNTSTVNSRTGTITVNSLVFTITQAAAPPPDIPSVVSVSPMAGTGTGAIFTAVFADTGGAQNLSDVRLLVAPTTLTSDACYVRWQKATGTFSLANDDGVTWMPMGSADTVNNSVCTLSATSLSAVSSGNQLSVTFNISAFSTYFLAGSTPVNVYLQAFDGAGPTTGLVRVTTYYVAQLGAPSINFTLTPVSSTATEQTFHLTATPTRPLDYLLGYTIVINNITNDNNPNVGVSEDEGACALIIYTDMSSQVLLIGDDGGLTIGSGLFGQAKSLSNNQCTINLSKSPANSNTYSSADFYLDITASSGFKGTEQIYVQGWLGPQGTPIYSPLWTPLDNFGSWTAYPLISTTSPPVSAQSVTPSAGAGLSPIFTFVASSANGWDYISKMEVWFNTAPSGNGGCQLLVDPFDGSSTFLNDDGSSQVATIGTATTFTNSSCSINLANVSLAKSGNTRTLTLPVTFFNAFSGTQIQYLRVTEKSGNTTGWAQVGSWNVQSVSGTPTAGALSPASGQGLSQAFTLTASDSAGAADLASVPLLINNSASSLNACAVTYVTAQNVFQLANDAGAGVAGSVAPGQAATVSNSQRTLSGTGSSVQILGQTMTLVVNLFFNPTFASIAGGATKNIYTSPVTSAGITLSGGPALVGTWTVPSTSPTPTITSLSPPSVAVGSTAFTLTVNGTNFVSGAIVKWNGAALSTSFLSATQLTAAVSATLVASAGTPSVTVVNPGGVSSAVTLFKVEVPPTLTSISPTSLPINAEPFTLTVNGTGFISGAVVKINGNALITTYVSSTKLQATVSTSANGATGLSPVTVMNPSGLTSGSVTYTTLPFISVLSPNSLTHGGATTTLYVEAFGSFTTDFVATSVVQWNGTPLATTFLYTFQLTATVPASLLTRRGTASVTVYTPGVGTSPPATFTIQ